MTELAVKEEIAQRARDRAKGERLPGDVGLVVECNLEAFRAGSEVEVEEPRAKHHVDLVDLRQADERQPPVCVASQSSDGRWQTRDHDGRSVHRLDVRRDGKRAS